MMLTAMLLAIQAASDETGSLTVVNAVPGAMVHLLRLPPALKDPGAFARIWSENDDVQQEALAAMPDDHARFAPGRIRDLARIGSVQVQALAKLKVEKMGAVEDPKPVVRRVIADIEGIARFQKLAGGTYHVYSTRPMAIDFHRQDVKVEPKGEATLDAAGRPAKPAEADVAGA